MVLSVSLTKALHSHWLRVHLPALLCFLVINLTTDQILGVLEAHGALYGTDPSPLLNAERTAQYFIIPAKSLLFFVCTAALIFPLLRLLFIRLRGILGREHLLRTAMSMLCCFALVSTILPSGFGRFYARISTDPFNQVPNQLYRRLLLPGLANLYHLDGFLYTFFIWGSFYLVALTVRFYFLRKNVSLSVLQETSLLTTGCLISAFQLPGQPEFLVFFLGMLALIEFEEDGQFTWKQMAAFSLALMTHEACAIIIFAPMIIFIFGRRAWIPCLAIGAMYALTVLADFWLNPSAPLKIQSNIAGMTAAERFRLAPYRVPVAALCSFKFLWLFLPVGLYFYFRETRRYLYFMLSALALAFAGTYTAVDYTRVIGFAIIPMLLCFLKAKLELSHRAFQSVVVLNLITPSVLFSSDGLSVCRGLYSVFFRVWGNIPHG